MPMLLYKGYQEAIGDCRTLTYDNCDSQEGRHYCLLHGIQVKNMELMRCGDFTMRMTGDEECSNNC
jgi:hypothetical protein